MMGMDKHALTTLALLLTGLCASAAPIWQTGSWHGTAVEPAADNLVLALRGRWANGTPSDTRFTDGVIQQLPTGATTGAPYVGNNASLTFSFPEPMLVREVRLYTTWGDDGRDRISVSSVTAVSMTNATPVTLSPAAVSADYSGYATYAHLVDSEGGDLAGGVESVTVNFGAQEASNVGYAEIEIVGAYDVELSRLVIDGYPASTGVTSPGYGTHALEARTLSAPAVWTNDAQTLRQRCAGWKIYRLDASGQWIFDETLPGAQGTASSFDFTPPTSRGSYRVVWQWEYAYAARVSTTAGGTASVSPADFVAPGTAVTVAAEPGDPAGYVFWTGDLPPGMATDARSHTFTLVAPVAPQACFSGVLWVDDDAAAGGDGTQGAPFKKVDDALAAAPEGAIVVVRPGTYQLSGEKILSSAITLQGETGDFSDVEIRSASSMRRALTLSSPLAIVRGLTLRGMGGNANGVVRLTAGLLDHCRVTGGRCARVGGGAGVYNEGGTVRRCTIDGNSASGNIYNGLGLCQTSGTTEYCFITNNTYSAWHGAQKHPCPAGAFVSGGTLRGTLIAFNSPGTMTESLTEGYNGFALYIQGTPVIDGCAIVENTVAPTIGALPTAAIYVDPAGAPAIRNTLVLHHTHTAGADLPLAGLSLADNSLFPSPTGISGTANQFENAGTYEWTAEGEFSLRPLSLAVDHAAPLPGVSYDLDLYGRPRVNGAGLDIGPVECAAQAQVEVAIRIDAASFILPHASELSATTSGFPPGALTYLWTIDGETISTEPAFTWSWPRAGVFHLSVSVSSAEGTATASDTLQVTAIQRDIYLNSACATPAYPYGTPETAATSFADIKTMMVPGGSLTVWPGTYTVENEIALSFPYEIRGVGDRNAIVLRRTGSGRLISLSHPDDYVHGLTFQGGSGYAGATMHLSGGARADNVNLFGGVPPRAGAGGGCLYIANATIRDSVIGNVTTANDINYGLGLRMGAGALVERCVITNVVCTMLHYASVHAQGVGVHMSGGILRNCLVADCRITDGTVGAQGVNGRQYAAGLYQTGGTVENCTIADNSSLVGPAGYYGSGGTMTNSIVCANVNDELEGEPSADANIAGTAPARMGFCFTGDPLFNGGAKASRPPYGLTADSPCVNAGVRLGWMDETATDLAGAPRVAGRKPDIGCYEFTAPLGTCIILQ